MAKSAAVTQGLIPGTLSFKFQYLNTSGQPRSVFAQDGAVEPLELVLGPETVPLFRVTMTHQFLDQMSLFVATPKGGLFEFILKVTRGDAGQIKKAIDQRSSLWLAHLQKIKLTEESKSSEFKSFPCPNCRSTIDLSGFSQTPQVYCGYCSTLVSHPGRAVPIPFEAELQICPECSLYGWIRDFSIFFFYFLGQAGWSLDRKRLCCSCARRIAWRNLWKNLPFVLGFPTALALLFKAFRKPKGSLARVEDGNILANAGDVRGADRVYEALIGDVPYLAGVHYNRGITALRSEDETTARARFQTALKYAANFEPAFDVLRNLYLSRRDQTFLKDLESAFGLPRPAAPDDPFGGQYDAQGYS